MSYRHNLDLLIISDELSHEESYNRQVCLQSNFLTTDFDVNSLMQRSRIKTLALWIKSMSTNPRCCRYDFDSTQTCSVLWQHCSNHKTLQYSCCSQQQLAAKSETHIFPIPTNVSCGTLNLNPTPEPFTKCFPFHVSVWLIWSLNIQDSHRKACQFETVTNRLLIVRLFLF